MTRSAVIGVLLVAATIAACRARAAQPREPTPSVAGFPPAASELPPVELPDDDAILGEPLVINGRVIPFEEVKREVCLGPLGVAEIEHARLEIFLDEEIRRRVAAGASLEELAVDDDEIDLFLRELDGQGVSLGTDWPKEHLRIRLLFEKLMLPADPAQFPTITVEAILANPGGDAVLEHCRATFQERQKKKRHEPEGIAERSVDDLILQLIQEHLLATATIVRDPAPGVLYRVNGVDITVDQIWKNIEPLLTTMEVRATKQWIVNRTLLKEAFVAAGAWLTEEEADAEYHRHVDLDRDSLFSQERIAVIGKHFPSVDRYKEYRRLYDSFHRLKKPQMTDEVLEEHAEFRTKKIAGEVTIDVDVLLCSAYDFTAQRWKEDGWIEAEKRMRAVLDLLVQEQLPWEELVRRFSDLGEPCFRNYQRNHFLCQMGDFEYDRFLNGSSITDFVFFEQKAGTLCQPMRGPLGWYVTRLIYRSEPSLLVPVSGESLRAQTLDDYLSWNLMSCAQDLIQRNEVHGLEVPANPPWPTLPTQASPR